MADRSQEVAEPAAAAHETAIWNNDSAVTTKRPIHQRRAVGPPGSINSAERAYDPTSHAGMSDSQLAAATQPTRAARRARSRHRAVGPFGPPAPPIPGNNPDSRPGPAATPPELPAPARATRGRKATPSPKRLHRPLARGRTEPSPDPPPRHRGRLGRLNGLERKFGCGRRFVHDEGVFHARYYPGSWPSVSRPSSEPSSARRTSRR